MTSEATELVTPRHVFITGACGFIGRALAVRYRQLGAVVAGIDLHADSDWGVIAADFTEPESWCSVLEGVDLVIHTAAIVSNTATLADAWRVNVKGTADLLEACAEASVGRFVQLSSVAAFGFDFPDNVGETYPLRPMGNTYVDTKIASEHAVLACHAAGRMDCTIVRPGDVYGPGSRPWVVLPLEMIAAGRFMLPAHGQGKFSPVYIDDLVQGVVLAGSDAAAGGQIYTITGAASVSCAEFFGYHYRMLGITKPVRTLSTGLALFVAEAARLSSGLVGGNTEQGRGTVDMLSRRAGYSIAKARQMLGYEPQFTLPEGMRRTAAWALEVGYIADAQSFGAN